LGGLTYFILFVGGFDFLPVHINSRPPGDLTTAILTNLGLMLVFGVHHTVAARSGFKSTITKVLPESAERSLYVLISGLVMLLIAFYWQPIEGAFWQVTSSSGVIILTAGYATGWFITVLSSFLINHFELFGLQQVYLNLRNAPKPEPGFTESSLYRLVRHPLQVGVLIGIWCTPYMTMTHLMLAVTMTIYIYIGLYYEEKDLARTLGPAYEDYQKRVRKLLPLPFFGARAKTDT
jgi:protein-S-isoprenylcysteine O-methyltransferase Ste14